MKRKIAYLQDIPIELGNNSQIMTILNEWLAKPSKSYQVVTLNAVMLITALRNLSLEESIKKADLIMIDGYGILLALKKRGYDNLERFTGVELTRNLLDICSIKRYSVYFLGGTPGVSKKLCEIIPVAWPGVLIEGIRDGYESVLNRLEIIDEIRSKQPRLLLVGLGTPDQETFLADVLKFLPGTMGIGVGGTFDILSGLKKEAPKWAKRVGIEWSYRMLQDPEKFKLLPDLFRFWNLFLRRMD